MGLIHNHPNGRPAWPRRETSDIIQDTVFVSTPQKEIKLSCRRNARGQFLRIDETRGHAHNAVIIPAESLGEVLAAVHKLFPGHESAAP